MIESRGQAGLPERNDIQVEITAYPGLVQNEIELQSSVGRLFGKIMRGVIEQTLLDAGLNGVRVKALDQGALDYVIRARVITALERMGCTVAHEPIVQARPKPSSMHRTLMFVPGNNPGMLFNAMIYQPDGFIFDLEDAVAITEKDAGRALVAQALRNLDYGHREIVVRINGTDTSWWQDDLRAMIPCRPHAIRLPKAETPEQIRELDAFLGDLERDLGIPVGETKIIAAVESARGVLNALAIASASPRMSVLAIGAEDLTVDLRAERSRTGAELMASRSQILLAARAAGLDAMDTVFANVADEEGFIAEVCLIKGLGFDGKSVIHPRQVELVHQLYQPTAVEIKRAREIVEAFEQAEQAGSGVVSLSGRMIDAPVVKRALRVLAYAAGAVGGTTHA